jgi:RHS repeat-associated protein
VGGSSILAGQGLDEFCAETNATATTSYISDGTGSTVAATNSSGAIAGNSSYGPYGTTTQSGSAATAFQYTGHENDGGTNLYYYRNRYYSPSLSRFISQDPIGLAGGMNSYAYVGGNPIARTDPLGLWSADGHHKIYATAFPGLNPAYLRAIDEGSDWVDYLLSGDSFMHSMREEGQSVADAQGKACDYIRHEMQLFNELKDAPGLETAGYAALGRALHTITDSTSPAHTGWQPWRLFSSDWEWHGNSAASLESLKDLTPALLSKSVDLVHKAMNGDICGCASN